MQLMNDAMCKKPPHSRNVDPCLSSLIKDINDSGKYRTILSCCGHGKYPSTILVLDKDTNKIFEESFKPLVAFSKTFLATEFQSLLDFTN